ncbi:MAG: FitA-like ribbon-helix-helix domain-containing protein [Acidimicrobiales bacterium]
MPSIQIKAVPPDVHAELRHRAAVSGKSLQDYLYDMLIEETRYPPLDEVLGRAGNRSGGRVSFEAAVTSVRTDRDAR